MPQQNLLIANFKTGLETDREPFIINNDAFPNLINAYIWRGKVLKKRGTSLLGRLEREIVSFILGMTAGPGTFTGNVFTIMTTPDGQPLKVSQPYASILPGSVSIVVGADTFTEIPAPVGPNGLLTGSAGGAGTVNYTTGAITLTGAPGATNVVITFDYFPGEPVLGLEDLNTPIVNDPILVAFDNVYSYQFNQGANSFYDTTFYKISDAPFQWTGTTYEQFWSANYQKAMWVTNGNPGMHFKNITGLVIGAISTFTVVGHGLVTGNYVYINEVVGTGLAGINGVSGPITRTGPDTFTLVTPLGAGTYTSNGIAQYMTNSTSTFAAPIDGIRWYDGDPTTTAGALGWVNFAPPLDNTATAGITQYLVGCAMILPFKGRLLAIGAWIQTSTGSPQYIGNRVVYSEDGTAYYAFPVPIQQVVDPQSWMSNVAGKGGFIGAPVQETIVIAVPHRDVILMDLDRTKMKFIFTGDDSLPFLFKTINSELGGQSTFSSVALDMGAISVGDYGIAMTTEDSAQRIDVVIPDYIFEFSKLNEGSQRVTSVRDYRNEWIYFTYPPDDKTWVYPSRSLLYNYRDSTWAQIEENYTHYGTFRRSVNITWADLGRLYGTWAGWTKPWNFANLGAQYPNIIGGNQQGFVLIKDAGTAEDVSQQITAISGDTFTSPAHCLTSGDYLYIQGAIGDAAFSATSPNGNIYQISTEGNTPDTFTIIPVINPVTDLPQPTPVGVYYGGGVYRRLSNYQIATKQFPIFWEPGRKSRVGTQRYLLENTFGGQTTVQIFLSQNDTFPANDPENSPYLIYSNIVPTFPSTANYYSFGGAQTWQRMSNSFIGDSVQIGFTLSDAQMRNPGVVNAEFIIHAIAFDLYPGPILV